MAEEPVAEAVDLYKIGFKCETFCQKGGSECIE